MFNLIEIKHISTYMVKSWHVLYKKIRAQVLTARKIECGLFNIFVKSLILSPVADTLEEKQSLQTKITQLVSLKL